MFNFYSPRSLILSVLMYTTVRNRLLLRNPIHVVIYCIDLLSEILLVSHLAVSQPLPSAVSFSEIKPSRVRDTKRVAYQNYMAASKELGCGDKT
jgi:hypothetical protein